MKKERYKKSHEVKINKECSVQFNQRANGELHIKIINTGKKSVNLKEKTFTEITNWYSTYKGLSA